MNLPNHVISNDRPEIPYPPYAAYALPAHELGFVLQLFFDTEEAVVFCGAFAARGRASLDLARRRADREVGDGRVLRLAGAVADDDAPSRSPE